MHQACKSSLPSRMRWRLYRPMGPTGKLLCLLQPPNNCAAHACQHYILAWLLGRSVCSFSTKKFHGVKHCVWVKWCLRERERERERESVCVCVCDTHYNEWERERVIETEQHIVWYCVCVGVKERDMVSKESDIERETKWDREGLTSNYVSVW